MGRLMLSNTNSTNKVLVFNQTSPHQLVDWLVISEYLRSFNWRKLSIEHFKLVHTQIEEASSWLATKLRANMLLAC